MIPDKVIAAMESLGPITRRRGEVIGVCPAHEDHHPSLRVREGRDGHVLFHCDPCGPGKFAEIIDGLGLTPDDVLPERERMDRPQVVATYTYTDRDGEPVHRKLRYEPGWAGQKKSFAQEHWDGRAWQRGLPTERQHRYLYNFPAVLQAVAANEMVWIVEGEKDADAHIARGNVATTTTNGGREGWDTNYSHLFRGATVTVVADADEVGRDRARRIHEALSRVGVDASVRIVEAAHGKDSFDHFAAGGTSEDFLVTKPFPRRPPRDTWTLGEYLTRPRISVPYVVSNLLKRRERMMVIGAEGEGKSLFIRQLAVATAAGIGVFSGANTDPMKVLLIDAENEHEDVIASYEHLVGLTVRLGRQVNPDNLVITEASQRGGTKINTPAGRAWLTERVEAHQPDLLCVGPLYKVVAGTLINDEVCLGVVDTLDSVRDVCGSAIVVEHHPPLRQAGDQSREIRAFGSSVLVRWPNFSFGLEADAQETQPVYKWIPTRGSRVRGRPWPERLRHGNALANEWPWMSEVPSDTPRDDRVARRGAHAFA